MFPNCPLPEEGIKSFSPYLIGLSQWSKLSSKIWDNMFSVNAERPASEELISSLDAEILYGVSQLPPSLWWDPMALGKKIERVSRSLQGGKCVFCTWYTFKPLTFQKSPC